jgi:hypothetical protein
MVGAKEGEGERGERRGETRTEGPRVDVVVFLPRMHDEMIIATCKENATKPDARPS